MSFFLMFLYSVGVVRESVRSKEMPGLRSLTVVDLARTLTMFPRLSDAVQRGETSMLNLKVPQ